MQDTAQWQLDLLDGLPRYDITVRIDPAAQPQLTGFESVQLHHRGPDDLHELYFRLYSNLPRYGGNMSISGLSVNGQTAAFSYVQDNTALHISLPETVPPDSTLDVRMGFDLQVPRRETGYVLLGESQDILSLPLFYPILAVRDIQGGQQVWNLDVPPSTFGDSAYVETALYTVTATVPSEVVLASTATVVTSTVDSADPAWSHVSLAGGPRREFMLIMSRKFQTATVDACGARVTSYFLPEDRKEGLAAMQFAAAALRVYCARFAPYPFRDMAVVAAPIRFFGMEYPGLNLLGIDLYRTQKQDLEFLTAHEVGHQWWYSVVGSDPVNLAWLDEGLTEYSTFAYYEAVYGTDEAELLWESRWRAPYQYAVEKGMDTGVNQPLSGFTIANYETMVYAKAALFFDSVRRELGDDAYYSVLREYLARYRWGLVVPADFLAVVQEVAGQDVSDLYRQWILTASRP